MSNETKIYERILINIDDIKNRQFRLEQVMVSILKKLEEIAIFMQKEEDDEKSIENVSSVKQRTNRPKETVHKQP